MPDRRQPEWMDLNGLTEYCSVSEQTLRSWIRRTRDPLPASQPEGKIMVKRSAFDAWMERQQVKAAVDVNAVVDEIMGALRQGGSNGRKNP